LRQHRNAAEGGDACSAAFLHGWLLAAQNLLLPTNLPALPDLILTGLAAIC